MPEDIKVSLSGDLIHSRGCTWVSENAFRKAGEGMIFGAALDTPQGK
jgi:hypothetical protein